MKQEIFDRWIELMKSDRYRLNFNNPIGYIEVDEDGLIFHPLGLLVLLAHKEGIVELDENNVVEYIDHRYVRAIDGDRKYISKLPKSVIDWAGMSDDCQGYTSIYNWPPMYHHSVDKIIHLMKTMLL